MKSRFYATTLDGTTTTQVGNHLQELGYAVLPHCCKSENEEDHTTVIVDTATQTYFMADLEDFPLANSINANEILGNVIVKGSRFYNDSLRLNFTSFAKCND